MSATRRADPWVLCALALPLLAFLAKLFLITRVFYAHGGTVADVGFGFGDYAQNLLHGAGYRSCRTPPFTPCDPALCVYATRMPALPYLLAGLAAVAGDSLVRIAVLKAALLSLLVFGFLRLLTARVRPGPAGVLLLALALLGPQVIKHSAILDYEEGFITELMLCFGIAVGLALRDRSARGADRVQLAAVALLLAGTMYLMKTTLAPLLLLTALFALSSAEGARTRIALVACALLFVAPLGAWWSYTGAVSGRATVSSSWNGENLFRGNNPESAAIYPDVSLDRVFDSRSAELDDHRVVALGAWATRRCFADEWQWNDYYAALGRDWLQQHPGQALRFVAKKAHAFFIDVEPVPRRVSPVAGDVAYRGAERWLGILWMAVARLGALTLLGLCAWAAVRGQRRALWPIGLLLAYAAPYVAVFTWQRHVVPALVASLVLLCVQVARARHGDEAASAS